MTYKIETGVPTPPRAQKRRKYPLGDMSVGDSFFVPGGDSQTIGASWRRFKPKLFTARTVTENGIKGVRVWRLE